MAQNVTQYCHVCKTQTTSGSPVVFLQSFVRSAQLSVRHLLRFVYEISAQFCPYHNFTIEPLCSPRNKSTVCNNTRSKHGAITVKSRQIQCRLSRPIGLFMKYRLVWFHICPCYDVINHTCVKSIILTRSIRILYNLECFYLRCETATITAYY